MVCKVPNGGGCTATAECSVGWCDGGTCRVRATSVGAVETHACFADCWRRLWAGLYVQHGPLLPGVSSRETSQRLRPHFSAAFKIVSKVIVASASIALTPRICPAGQKADSGSLHGRRAVRQRHMRRLSMQAWHWGDLQLL